MPALPDETAACSPREAHACRPAANAGDPQTGAAQRVWGTQSAREIVELLI
jgi:hypothetical protein